LPWSATVDKKYKKVYWKNFTIVVKLIIGKGRTIKGAKGKKVMKIKEYEMILNGIIKTKELEVEMLKNDGKKDKLSNEFIPLKLLFNESVKLDNLNIEILHHITKLLKMLNDATSERVENLIEYINFLIKDIEISYYIDKDYINKLTNEIVEYKHLQTRIYDKELKFYNTLKEIFYRNLKD